MPTRRTVVEYTGLGGVIANAAQAPRNALRVTVIFELSAYVPWLLSHCRVRPGAFGSRTGQGF